MSITVRPAVEADAAAVVPLIAREVARGTVLPHVFRPEEFLVAEVDGDVVGTLSLAAWTPGVVELGTVIAAVSGQGVGSRLVEAGLRRAAAEGAHTAVVLTGVPGWFASLGFTALGATPWARARGLSTIPPIRDPALDDAISAKSARSCARCPHLAGCTQALLCFSLPAVAQAQEAA